MSSLLNVRKDARVHAPLAGIMLLSIAAMLCAVGCAAPEPNESAQVQSSPDAGVKMKAADNSIAATRQTGPHARAAMKAKPGEEAKAKAAASESQRPCCPTPTVASVPPHKSKTSDGKMPKLAIENTVSVAPPVWPSNRTKHTFKLANTGDAPLHIRLKGG